MGDRKAQIVSPQNYDTKQIDRQKERAVQILLSLLEDAALQMGHVDTTPPFDAIFDQVRRIRDIEKIKR